MQTPMEPATLHTQQDDGLGYGAACTGIALSPLSTSLPDDTDLLSWSVHAFDGLDSIMDNDMQPTALPQAGESYGEDDAPRASLSACGADAPSPTDSAVSSDDGSALHHHYPDTNNAVRRAEQTLQVLETDIPRAIASHMETMQALVRVRSMADECLTRTTRALRHIGACADKAQAHVGRLRLSVKRMRAKDRRGSRIEALYDALVASHGRYDDAKDDWLPHVHVTGDQFTIPPYAVHQRVQSLSSTLTSASCSSFASTSSTHHGSDSTHAPEQPCEDSRHAPGDGMITPVCGHLDDATHGPGLPQSMTSSPLADFACPTPQRQTGTARHRHLRAFAQAARECVMNTLVMSLEFSTADVVHRGLSMPGSFIHEVVLVDFTCTVRTRPDGVVLYDGFHDGSISSVRADTALQLVQVGSGIARAMQRLIIPRTHNERYLRNSINSGEYTADTVGTVAGTLAVNTWLPVHVWRRAAAAMQAYAAYKRTVRQSSGCM